MKEFTNRVNATLPLDEPDYVQLTLIQSHSDKLCGACPAGQSLSASGRCVGLPITAQTVATAQKEVLPWKAALPGAARRTAAVQTGADDGGFYRTAARTHGDRRPSPDIS